MKLTVSESWRIARYINQKFGHDAVKSILESCQQCKAIDIDHVRELFIQIVGQKKTSNNLQLFIAIVYNIYNHEALNGYSTRGNNTNKILSAVTGEKYYKISKLFAIVKVKYQHVKSFKCEVDSYLIETKELSTIESLCFEK